MNKQILVIQRTWKKVDLEKRANWKDRFGLVFDNRQVSLEWLENNVKQLGLNA